MEERQMPRVLKLEDVLAGIRPIVEADPQFIYPQQAEADEDDRCTCVEVDADENEDGDYLEEHFTSTRTALGTLTTTTPVVMFSDDGAPACVVGHYFVKELGFDDLYNFETKAPTFILEAHGYEVEAPAQRFLNTIQSQQDQGWEWETAYDQAVKDVERQVTNEAE